MWLVTAAFATVIVLAIGKSHLLFNNCSFSLLSLTRLPAVECNDVSIYAFRIH